MGTSTKGTATLFPWKDSRNYAADGETGTVYLIHFAVPYRHARHYVGWTVDLAGRLYAYAYDTKHAANLIRVVNAAGIGWELARVWEGVTRQFERRLKEQGHRGKFCPCCHPDTFLSGARMARRLSAGRTHFPRRRGECLAAPCQHVPYDADYDADSDFLPF